MGTDFTPDPPQSEPEAPAPDPQIDQARALYEGLHNLDRRGETLAQVLKPGQDLPPGMDWNQARQLLWQQSAQQPEPQPDPFEAFAPPEPVGWTPDGQPVFNEPYQPEAPAFDPRDLQPVFEHFGQDIERRVMERIQQEQMQARQQESIQRGVTEAISKHQLPDDEAEFLQFKVQQAVQQQPHRAPRDLADEIARARLESINRRFVAQGGAPPRPGAPAGPIPGEEPPKTEAEAMERSRRYLNPSV